jgi:hypothetical protein
VCVGVLGFQGYPQTGWVMKLQHRAQKSGVVRSNKVCGHMIDVLTENKQYMTITGSYLKYHKSKRKRKPKVACVHAMKASRGYSYITPLMLICSTKLGCIVNFIPPLTLPL